MGQDDTMDSIAFYIRMEVNCQGGALTVHDNILESQVFYSERYDFCGGEGGFFLIPCSARWINIPLFIHCWNIKTDPYETVVNHQIVEYAIADQIIMAPPDPDCGTAAAQNTVRNGDPFAGNRLVKLFLMRTQNDGIIAAFYQAIRNGYIGGCTDMNSIAIGQTHVAFNPQACDLNPYAFQNPCCPACGIKNGEVFQENIGTISSVRPGITVSLFRRNT